jgi:AAA15 family ATPase/GTPase
MRVSSIRLKNFKRFTDLSIAGIPATAKLVILVGPNGCGKSSLFEGLFHHYRAQAGHGIGGEKDYALKDPTLAENWHGISQVEFHDQQSIKGNKRSMHFRTAYRNSADFTVSQINRLGRAV